MHVHAFASWVSHENLVRWSLNTQKKILEPNSTGTFHVSYLSTFSPPFPPPPYFHPFNQPPGLVSGFLEPKPSPSPESSPQKTAPAPVEPEGRLRPKAKAKDGKNGLEIYCVQPWDSWGWKKTYIVTMVTTLGIIISHCMNRTSGEWNRIAGISVCFVEEHMNLRWKFH